MLEGMVRIPSQGRVRGQGWKAHLCRRAACRGAPGKRPPRCRSPGRGGCGCPKQGERGLCSCWSRGATGTTDPSRLRRGEGSPDEAALGSWPPRSRAGEGGDPGLALPRAGGAGNPGSGPEESGIPGRPVTGSTVDPAAPVPKESPAQKCFPGCSVPGPSPRLVVKFQTCLVQPRHPRPQAQHSLTVALLP